MREGIFRTENYERQRMENCGRHKKLWERQRVVGKIENCGTEWRIVGKTKN